MRMILTYIDSLRSLWDNDYHVLCLARGCNITMEAIVVQLGDLSVGEKAKIIGYLPCDRDYRRRLLVMGLTPGVEIKVVAVAPFGDPIEINARGYCLCLRKTEAKVLKLEKVVSCS